VISLISHHIYKSIPLRFSSYEGPHFGTRVVVLLSVCTAPTTE